MMRGRRAASCFQGCGTHNLWTRHFAGRERNYHLLLGLLTSSPCLYLSLFLTNPERGSLKEISIMNKCWMVIEVEQPLKESPGRYNQGL